MAAVYIDYGLYASSDQKKSGTWSWIKLSDDLTGKAAHASRCTCLELPKTVRPSLTGTRPGNWWWDDDDVGLNVLRCQVDLSGTKLMVIFFPAMSAFWTVHGNYNTYSPFLVSGSCATSSSIYSSGNSWPFKFFSFSWSRLWNITMYKLMWSILHARHWHWQSCRNLHEKFGRVKMGCTICTRI